MKNYLIKLKNIFAFRKIKNQCFFILILTITFIYVIVKQKYILLIIIFFLLLLFFIYNKTLLYYSIIIILIIGSILLFKKIKFNNSKKEYINNIVKVYKVIKYEDYEKVYINVNNTRYYFNDSSNMYFSGDILYIEGNIKQIPKAHYEHGFNYYDYMMYQDVVGKLEVLYIEKVDHTFGINIFHEKLSTYIRSNFKHKNASIIEALIIGEKHNLDSDINKQIKLVGISHLFVISGLHIELINKALDKFLSLLKVPNRIKYIVILVILLLYFMITSFLVSILRVIISFIFNKIFKLKSLNTIDKLSLNAVIVLLINPFNLFSYSFLLSYMIVFGILIISPKLKKEKGIKSFIFNNIFISFTSTLISLPIVIRISSDINLLSILFNLFFIPFVSYIMLPLSFIVFVIPPLEVIYSFVVDVFLFLIKMLSKIDILTISFGHISLFFVIIFYLLFFLSFINKKYKIKRIIKFNFIFYLVFLFYLPYFNPVNEVSFLDLPSGEATFIHIGYNKKNILIDTGDVDASNLVSFLKSKGVKKLDTIIISHGDSDHIGGLKTLIYEFRISNIYLSYYDSVSKEIISNYHLPKTNIYYLKKGDEFYIEKLYFKVLWPSSNQFDVNNNSLVIYSKLFNVTYLFTGDIEKDAEIKFVKEVGKINVDVLKIAHHGSKTSTTYEFLNSISFKYAVAMNGYQNTFGFPHETIVKRINSLNNVVMFNTLDSGTITFYKKNSYSKVKISTSYK